jgi:hypothetical protein
VLSLHWGAIGINQIRTSLGNGRTTSFKMSPIAPSIQVVVLIVGGFIELVERSSVMRRTFFIQWSAVVFLGGLFNPQALAGDPLDEIDGTEEWNQGARADDPRKLHPAPSKTELKKELNEWETIRQAWLLERQNYLKEQRVQKKAQGTAPRSSDAKKSPPVAPLSGDLEVVPIVPPTRPSEASSPADNSQSVSPATAASKNASSAKEIPSEPPGAMDIPSAFKPSDKTSPVLKQDSFHLATQPDRTPAQPRSTTPTDSEKDKKASGKQPPKPPSDEPGEVE